MINILASQRFVVSPFQMLVPRVTYFPIVLDKVDAHFRRVSGADREDMPWLEYKRSPLKWYE